MGRGRAIAGFTASFSVLHRFRASVSPMSAPPQTPIGECKPEAPSRTHTCSACLLDGALSIGGPLRPPKNSRKRPSAPSASQSLQLGLRDLPRAHRGRSLPSCRRHLVQGRTHLGGQRQHDQETWAAWPPRHTTPWLRRAPIEYHMVAARLTMLKLYRSSRTDLRVE